MQITIQSVKDGDEDVTIYCIQINILIGEKSVPK